MANVDNLRDVSGYPAGDGRRTRRCRLLRSGDLSQLDAAGLAVLEGMGLRTVIDLRDPAEAATGPDALHGAALGYEQIPIFDGDLPGDPGTTITGLYKYAVDHHRPEIARVFASLTATDALPALVHCTAGKDRTGIIVALALSIAGVPREVIVQDYAASAEQLGPEFVARILRQFIGWDSAAAASAIALTVAVEAPPQAMADTLEHIDTTYGGVQTYLTGAGIAKEDLAQLAAALTEPDPDPDPDRAGF